MKDNRVMYIHVGVHKTGSTSIQATLFDKGNKAILENHGFYYFSDWQKYPTEPRYYNMFSSKPEEYHINIRNNLSRAQIQQENSKYKKMIRKQIESIDSANIIISEEDISHLNKFELDNFKTYLEACTSNEFEIKIIFVVRNPQDLVTSRIQQNVKYGGKTIENDILSERYIWKDYYEKRILAFYEVFGTNNVLLFKFEELINDKLGFVGGFISKFGIEKKIIESLTIKTQNTSFSNISIELISYINEKEPLFISGKINTKRESWDTKFLEHIKGEKFYLTSKEMDQLKNEIKSQIEWLNYNCKIKYDYIKPPLKRNMKLDRNRLSELNDIIPRLSNTIRAQIVSFIEEISKHERKNIYKVIVKENLNELLSLIKQKSANRKMPKGKTLILHIGSPKTGTSSIQTTLLNYSEKLKEYGVIYSKKMHHNNLTFHPLFLDKPQDSMLWISHFERDEDTLQKNNFLKEWNDIFNSNYGHYIVSSESLMYYSKKSIKLCMSFLRKFFDKIKIVVYIRYTPDYYKSLIQQTAKQGAFSEDLIEKLKNIKKTKNTFFLRNWHEHSNADDFIVRPFDKKAFINGNLIEDFFLSSGLDFIDSSNFENIYKNQSIGNNSIAFLSVYNKKYPRTIDGKTNEQRGGAKLLDIIDIYNRVDDIPFELDIKFTEEEAKSTNLEIDYINTFFKNQKFAFDYVESSEEETVFLNPNRIDISYFVELINEYNKYIEKLNNKIKKLENSQEKN